MSKLVFKEMSKNSAEDLATIAMFFGRDESEHFAAHSVGCVIGFRDGAPVVGSSFDEDYSCIFIDVAYQDQGLYQEMLVEVERLARANGTASIETGSDAITDIPEFIAACYSLGFRGDCCWMAKILDEEKHRIELEEDAKHLGKVAKQVHRMIQAGSV